MSPIRSDRPPTDKARQTGDDAASADAPPSDAAPSSTRGRLARLRPSAGGASLQWALRVLQAGPVFILVALIATMGILSPYFLTGENFQNLGMQTSIIAALALGQLLVILTRGIDISVGSNLALSSVVGGLVAEGSLRGGASVVLAILLTGAAVGVFNGLLIVKGRIGQPLIVTVATLGLARGLALILTDGEPISGMPPAVITAGSGFIGPIPVPVLLVGLAAALLGFLMSRTQWGRWVYAVGGNPEAAERQGIPTGRVVMSTFVVCGLMAGFAGLLTAGRTASASPIAGQLLELDAITAVIIGGASLFGGRGSVPNVIVGALILGVIRNGLDLLSVEPFYQSVAIGIAIIFALELDVVRTRLEERLRAIHARAMNTHDTPERAET